MSDSPWAMQLVVRVEKIDPPTTTAVCGAAALAAVEMLRDERSDAGGLWHQAIQAWTSGPIRKLTRRARGAAWGRAQEPEGITVAWCGAEVRAFVPSRMDEVPEQLAKLQIKSSALDQPEVVDSVPDTSGLIIAVTPRIDMTWGKQAAQCAHAAQIACRDSQEAMVADWFEAGTPLTVVHPGNKLWPVLVEQAAIQIRDGGYTEVPAGTRTTIAWWA